MAGFFSAIAADIKATVEAILVKPKRQIGALTADAVLEEIHQDDMQITDHPVEQGAIISDHAYKLPVAVVLTYGFSESTARGRLDPNYLKTVYQQFLQIQGQAIPFDIYTGKRHYTNMLIQALTTSSDKNNEHSMIIRVTCREVLIATTQVVTMTDQTKQAVPEATTGVQNQGTKQLATPDNTQGITLP